MENENATPTGTNSETATQETNVENGAASAHVGPVDIDAIFDSALGPADPNVSHKNLNYEAIVSSLPQEAKQLIQNLRGLTTKKTQELSKEKKYIEEEKQKLLADRNLWLEQNEQKYRQVIESDVGEIDPYSEAGIKKLIEKGVAEKLLEQTSSMKEQVARHERQLEIKEFKMQHPDITNYSSDLLQIMAGKPWMKIEDAYWIAKGRDNQLVQEKARQEAIERQEAMRKVSVGSNVNSVGKPSFGGDALAVYRHMVATGEIKE